MKKIISGGSLSGERVTKFLFFGIFVHIFLIVLQGERETGDKFSILINTLVFSAIGICIFISKSDIIYEVYDEGSTLLFIKDGKQVRINLSEVDKINFYGGCKGSSPRVVISLRDETELGKKLSFYPAFSRCEGSVFSFKGRRDMDIIELIERINKIKEASTQTQRCWLS